MKVTVAMCVYKPKESFLREAIMSVSHQRLPVDKFLIVIDDTQPETMYLVKKILKEEWRAQRPVQVIINTTNLGLSASRNIALDNTSSKWILFLDQDDVLYKSAISNAAKLVRETSGSIAALFSTANIIDDESNVRGKYMDFIQERLTSCPELLLGLCFLPLPTTFINMNVVKSLGISFKKSWKIVEDFAFWLELGSDGRVYSFKCYEGPAAGHRIHSENTSHDEVMYQSEHAQLYSQLLLDRKNEQWESLIIQKANAYMANVRTLRGKYV